MTISAIIIADSISPQGIRLTTMQLRYPRFIHAEELTHRILETQPELVIYEAIPDGLMYDQNLSRNASSSRAIPVQRLIEDIYRDPVIPIHWGKNQKGMQAREEVTPEEAAAARSIWLKARDQMIDRVMELLELGIHKQLTNRLLEPWAHINVVVTATDWANFYALRRHADAQPEIKALADAMWEAQQASTPEPLQPGEWHLPYVLDEEFQRHAPGDPTLRKVSVARCARVSYLTHEGKQSTVEEDLALYARLMERAPLHASPAEHQATPDELMENPADRHGSLIWEQSEQHGNLRGWRQFRKTLPGECVPG